VSCPFHIRCQLFQETKQKIEPGRKIWNTYIIEIHAERYARYLQIQFVIAIIKNLINKYNANILYNSEGNSEVGQALRTHVTEKRWIRETGQTPEFRIAYQ
jgi:hypothetical protein